MSPGFEYPHMDRLVARQELGTLNGMGLLSGWSTITGIGLLSGWSTLTGIGVT